MTGFLSACKESPISNQTYRLKVIELLANRYPHVIGQKNYKGMTGFILACKFDQIDVVKYLIENFP